MIRYLFERFDEDWVLVTYVFTVRHRHFKRLRQPLANPYIVFRAVIREAMRRGEIPKQDLELATTLVTGAMTQVFDSRILGRFKDKLAGFADATSAACLRLLGA